VQIRRRGGEPEPTPFERWGGAQFFVDLVERFYAEVVNEPLLAHMYPEDVTESKEHLALFLMQYWGGPSTYNEQRGAPRLRMRHVPFVIGHAEAEAWLRHMTASVQAAGMQPEDEKQLLEYLVMAAGSLVNART
jgi:hemoglobin